MEINEKEYTKLKRFWDTAHKSQRKWATKNREKLNAYMREYRKKQKVDNEKESVIIESELNKGEIK